MEKKPRTYPFSVRIYGILIHDEKLLVTEEKWFDTRMVKLPGGGLEFGESPVEALQREFREECDISIEVKELLYVPRQFIPAVFYLDVQVVPVYYRVESDELKNIPACNGWHDEEQMQNGDVFFHWIPLSKLSPDLFSFPGEKEMIQRLL